jgi:hypothetical protein
MRSCPQCSSVNLKKIDYPYTNTWICNDCNSEIFFIEEQDPVDHPSHYQGKGLEAITVIEAFGLGFSLGNTIKYILRAEHKGNKLQDLKKALWYLNREIEELEKSSKEKE